MVTRDGHTLGEVKEVRDLAFPVDIPMRPDYWLSIDCTASTEGSRYTLVVDHDAIGNCTVDPADGLEGTALEHNRLTGAAGVHPNTTAAGGPRGEAVEAEEREHAE